MALNCRYAFMQRFRVPKCPNCVIQGNPLSSRSFHANQGKSSETNNAKLAIKTNHHLFDSKHLDALKQVANSMFVIEEFVTEDEEKLLLDEVENILKRIRYETSHWDDAIHNYRETEYFRWRPDNQKIIDRVRQIAFSQADNHIKYVHILDIAKDGYIKPHVDAVRFCGDTISGISLLSNSVMRLRLEPNRSTFVDIFLKRRSLYIMTGDSRYLYAHEILKNEESYFKHQHVERDRRISVICRNEPPETTEEQS